MSEPTTPISRRAHARWPVSIEAHLVDANGRHPCRIVDIAIGGARLHLGKPTPRDGTPILDLAPYGRLDAEVAWCTETIAGLRFRNSPETITAVLEALAMHGVHEAARHDAEQAGARFLPPQSLPLPNDTSREPLPVAQDEALQEALGDNRQLRATISALRESLEETTYSRDRAVQDAVATCTTETQQLHDTVQAVRDELDSVRADKAAAIESAVAELAGQVHHLRATIASLREEMENREAAHHEELQRLTQAAHNERDQLQAAIRALRERLEAQPTVNEDTP